MKQKEASKHTRRTAFASLAALGSAILASSCCLPLMPFLFAAGTAGTAAFFLKLRPYLMSASALFVAFGFYQSWRAKKCQCQPGALSRMLLWFSLLVVLVFLLFPQAIANALAGLTPEGQ